MWMIRRVVVSVAMLVMIFAGTVLIGRSNHAPSRLEALGFDVCASEPCFRGIKVGTDWKTANARVPEQDMVSGDPDSFMVTLAHYYFLRLTARKSADGIVVAAMTITTENMNPDANSVLAADI